MNKRFSLSDTMVGSFIDTPLGRALQSLVDYDKTEGLNKFEASVVAENLEGALVCLSDLHRPSIEQIHTKEEEADLISILQYVQSMLNWMSRADSALRYKNTADEGD